MKFRLMPWTENRVHKFYEYAEYFYKQLNDY